MSTRDLTAREVADRLRWSRRLVTKTATEHGIGLNLGGSAGYRFTADDVDRLRDALRSLSVEQSA